MEKTFTSRSPKNEQLRTFARTLLLPVFIGVLMQVHVTALGQNSGTETNGSEPLKLELVGSSEKAFYVVSTLIVGPNESILFDAQYKVSDGKRVADRIAATGKKLKAVILSHADHDHYMGAMEIVNRFPGTPVYMSATSLKDFEKRSASDLAAEKKRGDDPEVPDVLVEPQLLPSDTLLVDGQPVVVIQDLVGDVREPASSAIWIPTLQTVLAGDLLFQGMHPWLGNADIASRTAWRRSLEQIASLNPIQVVPGHKTDIKAPNSPDHIKVMIQYLDDYDAFMDSATTPDDVINGMKEKYPDLAWAGLMAYGAKQWFKK